MLIYLIFIFSSIRYSYSNSCHKAADITGGSYTDNRYMDTYVIRAKGHSGPKMCIRECLMQADCNAVNYKESSRFCELLLANMSVDTHMSSAGDHFSLISDWTMVRKVFLIKFHVKGELFFANQITLYDLQKSSIINNIFRTSRVCHKQSTVK